MMIVDKFALNDLVAKIVETTRGMTDSKGRKISVKTIDGETLRSVALATISIVTRDTILCSDEFHV